MKAEGVRGVLVRMPTELWLKPDPLEAFHNPNREMLQQLGRDVEAIRSLITSVPLKESSPTQSEIRQSALVSTFVGLYADDKKARKKCERGRTERQNLKSIEIFISIVGDKAVTEITRDDLVKYRNTLQCLPPNRRKNPKYRNRTIKQISEMKRVTPISPQTLNNELGRIGSFFNWLQRNGHITANPATDLSVRISVDPRRMRNAFSLPQLQQLLSGLTYDTHRPPFHHRFWLVPMALYTGARLEELCQLHVNDIVYVDGLPCFSFRKEGGIKRFKNCISERTVPIHSKILSLGFLRFIEERKAQRDIRIFPDLRYREATEGYGAAATKWFSGYRDSLGLGGKKLTFHSFRHTAIDHLKQKLVKTELIQSIVGQETGELALDLYGKAYRPEVLRPWLEQLDYDLDYGSLFDTTNNPYFR